MLGPLGNTRGQFHLGWWLFFKGGAPFGASQNLTTRWFKVTLSSPSWRSLNHLKGALNHPKKVTSRIARNMTCCVCIFACFRTLRRTQKRVPRPCTFLRAKSGRRWWSGATIRHLVRCECWPNPFFYGENPENQKTQITNFGGMQKYANI